MFRKDVFKKRLKKRKRRKKNYFFAPMILNIVVEHIGHLPFIARRSVPPFPFMVTSLASDISLFDLHLTQYPSVIL